MGGACSTHGKDTNVLRILSRIVEKIT